MPEKRTIDLDLWNEDGRKDNPAITVTGGGSSFVGSQAEFDRLCLILGGWPKRSKNVLCH
jgi:hypothetical protein